MSDGPLSNLHVIDLCHREGVEENSTIEERFYILLVESSAGVPISDCSDKSRVHIWQVSLSSAILSPQKERLNRMSQATTTNASSPKRTDSSQKGRQKLSKVSRAATISAADSFDPAPNPVFTPLQVSHEIKFVRILYCLFYSSNTFILLIDNKI